MYKGKEVCGHKKPKRKNSKFAFNCPSCEYERKQAWERSKGVKDATLYCRNGHIKSEETQEHETRVTRRGVKQDVMICTVCRDNRKKKHVKD